MTPTTAVLSMAMDTPGPRGPCAGWAGRSATGRLGGRRPWPAHGRRLGDRAPRPSVGPRRRLGDVTALLGLPRCLVGFGSVLLVSHQLLHLFCGRLGGLDLALAQQGGDAGDFPADLAEAGGVVLLAGGDLEAEVEQLVLGLDQLLVELVAG